MVLFCFSSLFCLITSACSGLLVTMIILSPVLLTDLICILFFCSFNISAKSFLGSYASFISLPISRIKTFFFGVESHDDWIERFTTSLRVAFFGGSMGGAGVLPIFPLIVFLALLFALSILTISKICALYLSSNNFSSIFAVFEISAQ